MTRAADADALGRPPLDRRVSRGSLLGALQQRALVVVEVDAAGSLVVVLVEPAAAAEAPLAVGPRHLPRRVAETRAAAAAEGADLELVVRVHVVVVLGLGRERDARIVGDDVPGSDHDVVRDNRTLTHRRGLVNHRALAHERARDGRVHADPRVSHDVRSRD